MSASDQRITDQLYEKVGGGPEGGPAEWEALEALAKLYERVGGHEAASALRWMARNRKRPYRSSGFAYTWFNANMIDPGLGDPESDIPGKLYERLLSGEETANHKSYRTLRAAEEDFFQAWTAARAGGWDSEAEVVVQTSPESTAVFQTSPESTSVPNSGSEAPSLWLPKAMVIVVLLAALLWVVYVGWFQ
jgi:hypothetical protein